MHEVGTSESGALSASPAHLLTADDVLIEGNQYGTYLAVRGGECDCALDCPQCVHEVVRYAVERANSGEDRVVLQAKKAHRQQL